MSGWYAERLVLSSTAVHRNPPPRTPNDGAVRARSSALAPPAAELARPAKEEARAHPLLRVAYGLGEDDPLLRPQAHRFGEPGPVNKAAHDRGQALGRAVEVDILADEACVGG